ncbi:MAG: histidine kinase [Agriterribacter sp.]
MLYARIILMAVLLLCSNIVMSQLSILNHNPDNLATNDEQYITKVIGAKDGLPSSEILTLFQDSKGFVWIGTSLGLSRYDGFTFENFLTCNKRQLGKTFGIAEDTLQHIIWVMSDAGLCFYSEGKLYAIALQDIDTEVYDICITQNKQYWIATSKGPAYFTSTDVEQIIHNRKADITHHLLPDWKSDKNDTRFIKKIVADKNGLIWFCDTNTLYAYNGKEIHTIWQSTAFNDHFVCITPFNNAIYFVTIITGVHKYESGNTIIKSVSFPTTISANLFLKDDRIYYLNLQGIHQVKTDSDSIELMSTIPEKENKWLSCIMVDNENNLWIGMHHALLFQQKKLFNTYHLSTVEEGVEFFGAYKKKDGSMLFGGSRGKIYQQKKAEGIHLVNNIATSNLRSEVKAILQDSRGWMWYTTGFEGIIVAKEKEILSIKKIEETIVEGYSFLKEDASGAIWSGGDGVLTKFTINHSNDSIHYKNYYSRLPGNNWFTFLNMIEGPDGAKWFAGAQGIFMLSNDSLQPYYFQGMDSRNNFSAIQKSNSDEVWLSTKGEGIWQCYFDTKAQLRIRKKYTTKDGLHTNIYTDLICDHNSNVWAVSYSGVTKIAHQTTSSFINNYNIRQGFPDENYHSALLYQQNDHCIWVVASSGLSFFDPSAFEQPHTTPALVLNSLQSADSMYYNNGKSNVLRLPYYKNNITLHFSGLYFTDPYAVQYYYRLYNNDTNWISNGNERMINFQNLAPGNYIIDIKAGIGSDNISAPLRYSFIIQKPFWQTWWFITACGLVIIALAGYWIKHREFIIQKKSAEKNAVQKQIADLEIKALKAQMNPHFVFNSLNSIAHLIAANQNERGIEYLSKFSKLLRIILDEWENNFVSLKDEIKMLHLYLQIESLRFGDSFAYTIRMDDTIEEEDVSVPAMLVHPVAENAVWHGLLHQKGERRLTIYFEKKEEGMIRCTIKDNGIGIASAKLMKEKRLNGIKQKSKGLQLVKERLKILEQQYGKPTLFDIKDIDGKQNPSGGTIVIIEFPVLYEN